MNLDHTWPVFTDHELLHFELNQDKQFPDVTYHDKIPRLIKNFMKTDTFQLFTMHRVAGRLFNIPLMYDLELLNKIKKELQFKKFFKF